MADAWLTDLEQGARTAAQASDFDGAVGDHRGFGRVRVRYAKRDCRVTYFANHVPVSRSHLLRLDQQFPLSA